MMEIAPQDKPGTNLFHVIDKQFKSDKTVNFQFHPEYASEASNLIAGLVPFLKDNGHSFHLKMFSPEAIQRQAKSRWDNSSRTSHSKTDIELPKLLAEDDDLNFTDEPTLEKQATSYQDVSQEPLVSVNIPPFSVEHMPSMRAEDDSISTFHPGNSVDLTNLQDPDEEEVITQVSKSRPPVSILRTKQPDQDAVSRISTSDSASRISSLETNIQEMDKSFRSAIEKLQTQALVQADSALTHGNMLIEIISLLKSNNINVGQTTTPGNPTTPPGAANHPQEDPAGDSSRAAGPG
jgi:hypothetical protein